MPSGYNYQFIAIKIFNKNNFDLSSLPVDFFKNEALNGKDVRDKNVIKIIDYDKSQIRSEYIEFIVMEYIDGGDLSDKIKLISTDTYNEIEIKNYFTQLLSGLKAIHRKYLHRDVKPENVLITSTGALKYTDFGLARGIQAKTRTRSLKGGGTSAYQAPEIWVDESPQRYTDIYALGIVFFELLTGKKPFIANTLKGWERMHQFEPVPNIKNINAKVPEYLIRVVKKMLEKDPLKRYQNIDDIEADLAKYWNGINGQSNITSSLLIEKIQETKDKKSQEEIKISKELEEENNRIRILNLHIKELVNQIDEVVLEINSAFPTDEGILIEDCLKNKPEYTASAKKPIQITGNVRRYSINGKSVSIEIFHPIAPIPRTSYISSPVEVSNFVILVGQIIANNTDPYRVGGTEIGKNIFYLENKSNNSGEWWISEAHIHPMHGIVSQNEHKALTVSLFIDMLKQHFSNISFTQYELVLDRFSGTHFEEILQRLL